MLCTLNYNKGIDVIRRQNFGCKTTHNLTVYQMLNDKVTQDGNKENLVRELTLEYTCLNTPICAFHIGHISQIGIKKCILWFYDGVSESSD